MNYEELEELREMAPRYNDPRSLRWKLTMFASNRGWNRLSDQMCPKRTTTCGYCRRRARTDRLVVNPITLARIYVALCRRHRCYSELLAWEEAGKARQRRTRRDWEKMVSPDDLAKSLISEHLPPQYPAVSRATLRAFVESGAEVATVEKSDASNVTALAGSIRSLGFSDEVYVELRDGQAVLRRIVREDA